MDRCPAQRTEPQFSLAYLLGEVALVAIALAAGRVALVPAAISTEAQAVLCCVALIAGCGALGGLCMRMAVGLIAGGVFAVAAIPLMWRILSASSL